MPNDRLLDRIIVTLRQLRRSAQWQAMQRDAYRMTDGSSLTSAQVDALEVLVTVDPISITDLAEHLGVDRSNLSRTVVSLADAGLVERVGDTQDRRFVTVAATPDGRQAHQRIARRRREQLRAILGPMDPARRRLLADLLEEYCGLVQIATGGDDTE